MYNESDASQLPQTVLWVTLLVGTAMPLWAERTDSVVLENGSRIVGEVKKLERGRLRLKTDDMGTIFIEWESIAQLIAKDRFQVEMRTGERYLGSLAPAPEKGRLQVIGDQEVVSIDPGSVVRFAPIKETVWGRMEGSLDLGFSFIQANEERQLSLGLRADYRTRRRLESLSVDSLVTRRDVGVDQERTTARFRHIRFLRRKHIAWASAGVQRNSELGLDLRAMIGGGWGFHLLQSSRALLTTTAGLGFPREDPSGSDASRTGTELILGLTYSTFTYHYPKTEISVELVAFPSLTESGRVRLEFDSSLRRELVRDFYLNLTLFDSFDSEPLAEDAEENDWGVITSIGWSF